MATLNTVTRMIRFGLYANLTSYRTRVWTVCFEREYLIKWRHILDSNIYFYGFYIILFGLVRTRRINSSTSLNVRTVHVLFCIMCLFGTFTPGEVWGWARRTCLNPLQYYADRSKAVTLGVFGLLCTFHVCPLWLLFCGMGGRGDWAGSVLAGLEFITCSFF